MWSRHGKIIGLHDTPRSYNILSDKNRTIRRNRRHLLTSNDEFCIKGEVEETSNRESDGIANQKLVDEKKCGAKNKENDISIHDETMYRTRSGREV